MNFLKQSTAYTVKMGPFLDATDGFTPEPGLTIAQADVKLSKNGGAFAQKNDTGGGTHDADGWYGIPINTTDTGTVNRLQVSIQISGARPVIAEFTILPAAVYDALIGGTVTLQTDTTKWNGTAVATPATAGYPAVTLKSGTGTGELSLSSGKISVATGGIAAASFSANAVDAAALGTDAVTEIVTAVGAHVVEGSYTLDQYLRLFAAILFSKVSGMDVKTPVFRDRADAKNRITATIDAYGNRSVVTVNDAT